MHLINNGGVGMQRLTVEERNIRIKKYARLIAAIGLNIQKGEEVWIEAGLDQPDFVAMCVEECYKLGAKSITVRWDLPKLTKLAYKYETVSSLATVKNYQKAKLKYMVKKLPTRLYIESDDPDALKGVNQMKMAKVMMKTYPIIKPYRDAAEDKFKWCIVGVPGLAWAEKVFPDLKGEEAINALWDAILYTTRVDENDPVENWNKHNAFLHEKQKQLIDLDLRKLIYHASNGTDFEVELIPHTLWGCGSETLKDGRIYNPNMPTEEIFTSPHAGRCEGTLVASKPLSYNGELIEDFSITFKNGKVSEIHAKKNEKLLETMVHMDEGASMLGEVALVPFESPINMSGILFFNTLYDENACCHVALGAGFNLTLPQAHERDITTEEAKELGINDSSIHVDFMIGTRDLSIVGINEKGERIQIFKDGTWAF